MTIKIQNTDGKSKYMPAIFALRHEVFVIEQHVPIELEIDEFDETAIHFLATIDEEVIGTLRMLVEGTCIKIGRVAVKENHRKLGIGKKMMEEAINYAKTNGCHTMILGAQLTVVPFYEKLGFAQEGEIFDDAGIDHIMMAKKI